jgi:hypothetical protein
MKQLALATSDPSDVDVSDYLTSSVGGMVAIGKNKSDFRMIRTAIAPNVDVPGR